MIRQFSLNFIMNNCVCQINAPSKRKAVEYDRDHTKVKKPQVKPVLDHEVLIREARLVSETTFIYNSLRSFCDFHEKCFVRHVRSGISLCQAQDQLWVDAKHQMCTCGP